MGDYNTGVLTGEWIDIDQGTAVEDVLEHITRILSQGTSPDSSHEEWITCDYNNIPLSGFYPNLETAVAVAHLVHEYDYHIVKAYIELMGEDYIGELEDRYCETHASLEEYAYDLINECYDIDDDDGQPRLLFRLQLVRKRPRAKRRDYILPISALVSLRSSGTIKLFPVVVDRLPLIHTNTVIHFNRFGSTLSMFFAKIFYVRCCVLIWIMYTFIMDERGLLTWMYLTNEFMKQDVGVNGAAINQECQTINQTVMALDANGQFNHMGVYWIANQLAADGKIRHQLNK